MRTGTELGCVGIDWGGAVGCAEVSLPLPAHGYGMLWINTIPQT